MPFLFIPFATQKFSPTYVYGFYSFKSQLASSFWKLLLISPKCAYDFLKMSRWFIKFTAENCSCKMNKERHE